ncbi:hypothetical protein BHE74_00017158 [Ensete ventricosum]|nr:hypothetical protein BHE74_00017158 [Ensete ventricosum]
MRGVSLSLAETQNKKAPEPLTLMGFRRNDARVQRRGRVDVRTAAIEVGQRGRQTDDDQDRINPMVD